MFFFPQLYLRKEFSEGQNRPAVLANDFAWRVRSEPPYLSYIFLTGEPVGSDTNLPQWIPMAATERPEMVVPTRSLLLLFPGSFHVLQLLRLFVCSSFRGHPNNTFRASVRASVRAHISERACAFVADVRRKKTDDELYMKQREKTEN